MSARLPWQDYERDRLRSGMSYPVGRDLVERCLRDAGATVGTLVFAVPVATCPPGQRHLVEVFWFGDAKSRYVSRAPTTPADCLYLRLWAVESTERHALTPLVADALATACRWAATAPAKGTAWAGSNHTLTVHRNGEVTES